MACEGLERDVDIPIETNQRALSNQPPMRWRNDSGHCGHLTVIRQAEVRRSVSPQSGKD